MLFVEIEESFEGRFDFLLFCCVLMISLNLLVVAMYMTLTLNNTFVIYLIPG